MELIRQELKFFVPSGDRMSGFTESTDVIIPDSYPDFEESIFSCATINVKDELKQPCRVLISGQIDAVILYRSASGNELYRLNVPLSFAHVEDARDIGEGALYFIQYDVSHVDVRIINSRKINVTCRQRAHPHRGALRGSRLHCRKPKNILKRHRSSPHMGIVRKRSDRSSRTRDPLSSDP